MKWASSPGRSGWYWAHKLGRTSTGPTMCHVTVFEDFRWKAMFVKGGSYTFSEGCGWRWQFAEVPQSPAVTK